MPGLIWAPAALRDVQRLHRFLASKSPEAAQRAVKAIRNGVKLLAHQPGVGRPAEHMDPEFREWMIDFGDTGYAVLYRHDKQRTVVLTERHQRELGDAP